MAAYKKKPNSKIYKFLLFRKTLWFLFITKKQQLFFYNNEHKMPLVEKLCYYFFREKNGIFTFQFGDKK